MISIFSVSTNVSIHAPRFREAMPAGAGLQQAGDLVSIHAPRFREAMRFPDATCCLRTSFNPRPPFPGGDAEASLASRGRMACFNPRPPFPGGDALIILLSARPGDGVSIHAPRFREAMLSA